MRAFVVGVALLSLGAAAAPAVGAESLFERNRQLLLASLPEGAMVEVQRVDGEGALATELWTAEQYAAFRARHAAGMGRDYAAGLQGVPPPQWEQLYFCDIWMDLWGTMRMNVVVPRGLPRSTFSDKCWLYGGAGASTGVFESENQCQTVGGVVVCSSSMGWTMPQWAEEHGDCWFAGTGHFLLFPPPFGGLAMFDGLALCQGV